MPAERRHRANVIGVAVAAVLVAALAWPASAFDLQGHRGARGLAPENTLPAFAAALALGVTTLELDCGMTKDGVVVVAHDPVLNPDLARDPDGNYVAPPGLPLASLTLDEVKRYDVGRIRPGSRYAESFPDQQPVDGARIPTLAEVFALVRRTGDRRVRFNIETKIQPQHPELTPPPEVFAAAVIAEIRRAGVGARSTLQSFDWRTLLAVKRLAPEIETVWLTSASTLAGTPSPWLAGFRPAEHGSVPRLVFSAGGRIWSPNWRDLDELQLADAKALGLKVIPWTVNEPAAMAALIDQGVDGLITDRPDLLRQVMAAKGLPLPAPAPVPPN